VLLSSVIVNLFQIQFVIVHQS